MPIIQGRNNFVFFLSIDRTPLNICSATPKVVFIKNHKAASSTITVILQRYGLAQNKLFAVPLLIPYNAIFHLVQLFTANMTLGYQADDTSWDGFDMLVNHARLNRAEMDKVVKNAFYLTIIRHPVDHFESAWEFFGINAGMHAYPTIKTTEAAIAKFFTDPKFYFVDFAYMKHFRNYIWNGQLFDLGLDQTLFDNIDYVTGAIQRLDKELDLVMIKEYFDESLILLKKTLCLQYEDIVYIPSNIRNATQRRVIPPQIRQRITVWNSADMLMYNHFNRTFWDRVNNYGPTFYTDLKVFRELNRNVTRECADEEVKFSATFPAISCANLRKLETDNNKVIREMTKLRFNITKDIVGYPFPPLDAGYKIQ